MACKKPVIMAIDGVSRKLIEDADAGIYVEPENTDEMIKAISTYLQHPELIKSHGENGYAYVKQHFDRKTLAQQYIRELTGRCSK